MLNIKMGPQLMPEGVVPMPTPPANRVRNASGSSAINSPLPGPPETMFPFHLISKFADAQNAALLNNQLPKLDRSISEPNAHNKQQQQPSQSKNVLNPSRYKTEICRPFSENGFCKYGEKCQFAHGTQELKGIPRHPKYKTELCRTFHTVGFCPYGPRCHFIHSEDEQKLVEITQMKQQQAAQQAAREMAQQAAQLQAQQQALEIQLKALVSQVQHQLSGPMVTPGMPQNCDSKPRFNHSISVHPLMRDNLGSTADSPPESTTGGSPVLSPVFTEDSVSDSLSDSLGFASSPASADSSFNFCGGEISPLQMSPVKQQQRPQHLPVVMDPNLASLAASFQSVTLNNEGPCGLPTSPVFSSPPASPDYHSDNSSESNSHSRLPVFSKLAQQES